MNYVAKLHSKLKYVARCDEKKNRCSYYLLRQKFNERKENCKAVESFSERKQGMILGKLLDGTNWYILLDIRASKSIMSNSYNLRNHYMTYKGSSAR